MGPQLYRCGNDGREARVVDVFGASMGPQLYRCGNVPVWVAENVALISFNGAATLSLRKCAGEDGGLPLSQMLQWGRNFIVAEIYFGIARICQQWRASMGPQLYRCGNLLCVTGTMSTMKRFNGAATLSLRKSVCGSRNVLNPCTASMGPQLYRCGNVPYTRASP